MLRKQIGSSPFRLLRLEARGFVAQGVVVVAASMSTSTYGADTDQIVELPVIQVIDTTPLPGLGVSLKDVPANVQSFGAREIDRQRSPTLGDFLLNNAGSVTTNAAQGNPFQPDIYFRGFAASPVLGTPQGISVFLDGMRVNGSFGDVVNWDLIPRSAIARVDLIPGSNPVFGLNTLGGCAVHPDQGWTAVSRRVDRSLGRIVWPRRSEFRIGWRAGALGWVSDRHLRVRQRMGGAQLQHGAPNVWKSGLAGRAYPTSSQCELG